MTNKTTLKRLKLDPYFSKTIDTNLNVWSHDQNSYEIKFEFYDHQCNKPIDLTGADMRILLDHVDSQPKIYPLEIESKVLGLAKFVMPKEIRGCEGKFTAHIYADYPDRTHDFGSFTFYTKLSRLDGDLGGCMDEIYVSEFEKALEDIKEFKVDIDKNIKDINNNLDDVKNIIQEDINDLTTKVEEYEQLVLDNKVITKNEYQEVVDSRSGFDSLDLKIKDIDSLIDKRKIIVTPFDFGAKGDGVTDDFPALKAMFDFSNKNNCEINLLNGYTYLLKTKPTGVTPVFTINNRMYIDGFSTIKIADDFGDFFALFKLEQKSSGSVLKNFTINENSSKNNTTENDVGENTNRGTYRILFHGFGAEPIKNLTIDNLKINETLGVWQFFIYGSGVTFTNNNINYADYNGGLSVNYDRTTLYAVGDNWNVLKNKFKGSSFARTAFEMHGDNIVAKYNEIVEYRSPCFMTNDLGGKQGEIKYLELSSNRIKCRYGVRLWVEIDNNNVGKFSIKNNDIEVTQDYPCIMLEELHGTADDVTIKEVEITGNTLKNFTGNREVISFSSEKSNVLDKKPITIKEILIKNNTIQANTKEHILLSTNTGLFLKIEDVFVESNRFFADNPTRVIHVKDVNKNNIEKVYVKNNYFRFVNVDGGAAYLIAVSMKDNIFSENKVYSINNHVENMTNKTIAYAYQSSVSVYAKETFNQDMAKIAYDTIREGIIEDRNGVKKIKVEGVVKDV